MKKFLKKTLFLYTLTFAGFGFAADSQVPPNVQSEVDRDLKTPEKKRYIRGLILTSKEENIVSKHRTAANDVEAIELNVPGGIEALKGVLKPYLGKDLTNSNLRDVSKAIISYYKDQKLPPIVVKVQPKSLWGIVQITIESKGKQTISVAPEPINGILITGKAVNLTKKEPLKGIQIKELEMTFASDNLKWQLNKYIGKISNIDEIKSIQNDIIRFFKDNKLPGVTLKTFRRAGGVVQVLVTTKLQTAKKVATKKAAKKKSVAKKSKAKKPVFVKGIFITGNEEDIIKTGRTVLGLQIDNVCLPCGPVTLESVLSEFIGKRMTKKELTNIRKAINAYFKKYVSCKYGYAVMIKNTKGGVLQILIREQRVANVTYEGAKWWPEGQIAQIFKVYPGERFNTDKIKNNLTWLNQNVFHRSKIKLTPSKTSLGDVDIRIATKDRFPFRFYTTANNNGLPVTGEQRFSGGVTWGNAFFSDDILTYEVITSNAAHRFISQSGNYLTYLPWKHRFSVFGNYTKIKPNIPKHKNTAFTNQLRVRYAIPFTPLYKPLQHSVGFGFDMKYANSDSLNLAKPAVPNVIKKLQVAQLVGNYTLTNSIGKNYVWINYNVFWSPGGFLPHQNNKDFNKKRPHSKVNYAYFHLNSGDIYQLPKKFSFATSLSVQAATDTLPITELFTIGGFNTVRGYKPAEFNSDNGLIANFELRSPPLSPLKCWAKLGDKLTLLAFFDYGVGYNYKARMTQPSQPKDRKTEYALGTGGGLRYQIQQYLSFRCDYGIKLHKMHATNAIEKKLRDHGDEGYWYLGLLMAY